MTQTAKILDGKAIAKTIRAQLKAEVEKLKKAGKRPPGLGVILIGEDPASEVYVRNKKLACEEVGFYSEIHHYPHTITESQLRDHITALNQDPNIDGILVQLPLPKSIDESIILETILPSKDVDGFHAFNLGKLAQRKPKLRPCTPKGVITLLKHTGTAFKGKHAVVVGASNIVGRPMALELLNAGATVTVCHKFTQNLSQHVQDADILVVAAGKPHLIPGEWIKPGAIVIDIGMNRLDNGTFVGDVCYEEARSRASWVTPVPGGVGPMTVAALLENTLEAYKGQSQQA